VRPGTVTETAGKPYLAAVRKRRSQSAPIYTSHPDLHQSPRIAPSHVVVLLDLDNPSRVLRHGDDRVLAPTASYERIGGAPNVVPPPADP
jgi:hypothetical protein